MLERTIIKISTKWYGIERDSQTLVEWVAVLFWKHARVRTNVRLVSIKTMMCCGTLWRRLLLKKSTRFSENQGDAHTRQTKSSRVAREQNNLNILYSNMVKAIEFGCIVWYMCVVVYIIYQVIIHATKLVGSCNVIYKNKHRKHIEAAMCYSHLSPFFALMHARVCIALFCIYWWILSYCCISVRRLWYIIVPYINDVQVDELREKH